MNHTNSIHLHFNPELNQFNKKKPLRDGLSAVVQVGSTLWVANDETLSVERLSFQGIDSAGISNYGAHEQFSLNEYLSLPIPPAHDPKDREEVDVEGLDYQDGYLWLVGSHSRKRKEVKQENSTPEGFQNLADVSCEGNRFLLARIPLVKKDGTYTLAKEIEEHGQKRTAAQLHCTAHSSTLTEALAEDDHLQRFLKIPGKDNGFDVEGLAVAGKRVFIGLRGPVLRGWAVILEVELETRDEDPAQLKLKSINPHNPHNPMHPTYRKHFLNLGGLGVRDLCVHGSDLLILAGPTLALDGPVTLFRWQGGAQIDRESLVFHNELSKVSDIPHGHGKDHAEGVTLFALDGGEVKSILMVYDSASKCRQIDPTAVKADIFAL